MKDNARPDPEFDRVFELLPTTGWLAREEAELLWRAACDARGDVLELGVYYGRSATLLAAALLRRAEPRRGTLYLCDPYRDGHHFSWDSVEGDENFNAAITSLMGGIHRVSAPDPVIHVKTEADLFNEWPTSRRIGLLYADAHAENCENTREYLERWLLRVDQGGWIAVHDYVNGGQGLAVKTAVDALCERNQMRMIDRCINDSGLPGKMVLCERV